MPQLPTATMLLPELSHWDFLGQSRWQGFTSSVPTHVDHPGDGRAWGPELLRSRIPFALASRPAEHCSPPQPCFFTLDSLDLVADPDGLEGGVGSEAVVLDVNCYLSQRGRSVS